MAGEYIELNRTFSEISKDQEFDKESYDTRIAFGLSTPSTWEDLFTQPRVIILAEAGAGKTEEIGAATKKLRAQGKAAFFLRLEHLGSGFEDAFEIGDADEFDAWWASDETAWFFLDSVDEARLTGPKKFEEAIRKFATRLGYARQRVHVYITSRITEWRYNSDLRLVKNQLSITQDVAEKSDLVSSENLLFDQIEGAVDRPKTKIELVEPAVFALQSLNSQQIKIFAEAKGTLNAQEFVDAISKAEADIFATRPQDLEDLISFWKTNERIGSRLELLQNNIASKLSESDPDRANAFPLTQREAEYGAQTLAAAVTLLQETRILVPDAINTAIGIDVQTILPNWTKDKVRALLARPILDEAIYGSVRFHNRTLREYLTTQWIVRLLEEGKSRLAIERLFFTRQYDLDVVVPTMRPVLSWLVLFDDRIRERISRVAPEVLIEGGDPSQLPTDIRRQLLLRICGQYKAKAAHLVSFDISAVQRFAHPDLASSINSLLEEHRSHQEIQQLLLQMVWQAEITDCSASALKVALDNATDTYSRIYAIRAVCSAGSNSELEQLLEQLLKDDSVTDQRIVAEIIDGFAPDWLSPDQLVHLLSRIPPPKRHEYLDFSLDRSLRTYIKQCSPEQLSEFVTGLFPLIKQPPFVERRHFEVSEANLWVLKYAARAAERLVKDRHTYALGSETVGVISLAQSAVDYDSYRSYDHNLGEIIPVWRKLNHTLFWHDVAQARSHLDKRKNETLTTWWQARNLNNYWRFNEVDFEQITKDIEEQLNLDDRLVALSLAFTIYKEHGRQRAWRERLKKVARGTRELEEALHNFLHPASMSAQEKRWRRSESELKRRQKRRETKEAEYKVKWKKWLANNVGILTDTSVASKGTMWSANIYLMDRLRQADDTRDRWGHGRWDLLIPVFGEEIAAAFRDGAMNYWRLYKPELRSEGIENPNSVPYAVVFGLCGLEIEAACSDAWPTNLSTEEVKLACRYAFLEMNGFPSWLPNLYSAFPTVVKDAMLAEIEWEFSTYDGEGDCHYILSDVRWHADWIKPKLFGALVTLLEKYSPKHDTTLRHALNIVLSCQMVETAALIRIAKAQVQREDKLARKTMWFAVWMALDSGTCLTQLSENLASIDDKDDATAFAMHFLTALLGGRGEDFTGVHSNYNQADILRDLYILMYQYTRIEDGIDRTGTRAYSPELRADAQRALSQVFGLLKDIPGKATYLAILHISLHDPNENSRNWFESQARARVEMDADLSPWKADDICAFAAEAERHPHNHRELFDLVVSRLLDLKSDLEEGDSSIADILIQTDAETQQRKFIGNWLRDRSHGRYSVPQEEELADARRPDIRIHGSGFDGPVPIELKIADKNWSGAKLFDRMENQLCGDYLRDSRSRCGIYLLLNRGAKSYWLHPHSKKRISFHNLVSCLQSHAKDFIVNDPGIYEIRVIGIDLTLRSNS